MTDSAWSELTVSELVAQFSRYLTPEEAQEIIEFELDGEDTLGMVCATLNDRDLNIDAILLEVGADVRMPGPST